MKKTVRELVMMYKDGAGKLHADQTTQRGFIYNDMKVINEDGEITKAGDVVKSILERNIQLPALYFWNVQDPDMGVVYEEDEFNIHDGKQRFLSIFSFIRGETVSRIGGKEVSFRLLSTEEQNKLLDYEFDIVVRKGTLKEEEESFFIINTTGLPLTPYEGLRGAYHGKYIDEFEAYIRNCKLDCIRPVGRGEQCIWFLYLALGIIYEDKKKLVKLAQDRLALCRNSSFDRTLNGFESKVKLYNEFCKISMVKSNTEKNPQKICQIADYVVSHKYDTTKVIGYYYSGFTVDNDIDKWKFDVHKTALDNLIKNNISCDYRRFFNSDDKSVLYQKSNKCGGCGLIKPFNELEVDHITAWSKGGRTTITNAQLLCKSCNTSKGGK